MFWFSPLFALLVSIPAVHLLRRGGHSPWSALLLLIPLVNVVFIWWLAFGQGAQSSDAQGGDHRCNRQERQHAKPKAAPRQDDDVIEMPGSAA